MDAGPVAPAAGKPRGLRLTLYRCRHHAARGSRGAEARRHGSKELERSWPMGSKGARQSPLVMGLSGEHEGSYGPYATAARCSGWGPWGGAGTARLKRDETATFRLAKCRLDAGIATNRRGCNGEQASAGSPCQDARYYRAHLAFIDSPALMTLSGFT
jgi:hypothetical protein